MPYLSIADRGRPFLTILAEFGREIARWHIGLAVVRPTRAGQNGSMASHTYSQKPVRLSVDQCRAVDRYAIKELGIPSLVLMENAGRNAADLIDQWLRSRSRQTGAPGRVAIICGRGNNGGDGFVVARHLAHRGLKVSIDLAADPDKLSDDAAVNHAIVRKMGLAVRVLLEEKELKSAAARWRRADGIVDALLGTGFSGQVREPLASIIGRINRLDGPLVVALDVPSGLEADSGQIGGVAVRADRTITFLASKTGYDRKSARPCVGRVSVVDIGAPTRLILNRLRRGT